MSVALAVTNLTKRYAGRPTLAGVSLEIPAGRSTGLIGINGAGKSTLFRCILDLQGIDTGSIALFGADHRQPAARARLAWLPERFVPPPYATGREVLELLCNLHDLDYREAEAITECRTLDLDLAVLGMRARTYSKGMAQKLGLIACLVAHRPLLLLDEPMSGLDPLAHELFRRRLLRLKADGTTLFFSTHALADAEALCDALVWLHDGQVRYAGDVAGFLAAACAGSLSDAFFSALRFPAP